MLFRKGRNSRYDNLYQDYQVQTCFIQEVPLAALKEKDGIFSVDIVVK